MPWPGGYSRLCVCIGQNRCSVTFAWPSTAPIVDTDKCDKMWQNVTKVWRYCAGMWATIPLSTQARELRQLNFQNNVFSNRLKADLWHIYIYRFPQISLSYFKVFKAPKFIYLFIFLGKWSHIRFGDTLVVSTIPSNGVGRSSQSAVTQKSRTLRQKVTFAWHPAVDYLACLDVYKAHSTSNHS